MRDSKLRKHLNSHFVVSAITTSLFRKHRPYIFHDVVAVQIIRANRLETCCNDRVGRSALLKNVVGPIFSERHQHEQRPATILSVVSGNNLDQRSMNSLSFDEAISLTPVVQSIDRFSEIL